MTSTFIVTLEDDGIAALQAIEGATLTLVQQDVVLALISFLGTAASDTITYLGGFLKKIVSEISGGATATPAVPSVPPAGS